MQTVLKPEADVRESILNTNQYYNTLLIFTDQQSDRVYIPQTLSVKC